MPYPAGTLKFIMKGTIAGTQDWSIGIACNGDAPVTYSYDILQTFLNANTGPFVTFYNAISTIRGAVVTFNELRLEQYTGSDVAFTINTTAPSGTVPGSVTTKHPSYAAMCLGLLTNRPGGSYRGRVYIPALAASVDTTTGLVDTGVQGVARTALTTLCSAINDMAIGGDLLHVVVASRTAGVSTRVTTIRSDNVLDVQRRRTNDFARVYNSSPVT